MYFKKAPQALSIDPKYTYLEIIPKNLKLTTRFPVLPRRTDEFFADFVLLELSLKKVHKTNADKIHIQCTLYSAHSNVPLKFVYFIHSLKNVQ